jgi:hypothetical protein
MAELLSDKAIACSGWVDFEISGLFVGLMLGVLFGFVIGHLKGERSNGRNT